MHERNAMQRHRQTLSVSLFSGEYILLFYFKLKKMFLMKLKVCWNVPTYVPLPTTTFRRFLPTTYILLFSVIFLPLCDVSLLWYFIKTFMYNFWPNHSYLIHIYSVIPHKIKMVGKYGYSIRISLLVYVK